MANTTEQPIPPAGDDGYKTMDTSAWTAFVPSMLLVAVLVLAPRLGVDIEGVIQEAIEILALLSGGVGTRSVYTSVFSKRTHERMLNEAHRAAYADAGKQINQQIPEIERKASQAGAQFIIDQFEADQAAIAETWEALVDAEEFDGD